MKKATLFALFLLIMLPYTYAQDCSNFYFFQQNKTIEMTSYNGKGKETGKQVFKISSVEQSGDGLSATVDIDYYDKKGKSDVTATNHIRCNGGAIMMNMKMMLPQQQQEQYHEVTASSDDVYLEYPSGMSPGDQLKDGSMTINSELNNMKQEMHMEITNRQVVAKETITTPAGSWDCYKISYNINITIKTMGVGIPMKATATEWFAPGFGVVKTSTKHGSTMITKIE